MLYLNDRIFDGKARTGRMLGGCVVERFGNGYNAGQ